MKYVCLVYQEESKLQALTESDLVDSISACIGWTQKLAETGQHIDSNGLQSTQSAVTVRLSDGQPTVTDGPFAETKEVLGGFTIVEARDLSEAIQIASKFPALKYGCVEVRPVMELDNLQPTNPMDTKLAGALQKALSKLC